MYKKLSKKSQAGLAAILMSFIIISSSVLLVTNDSVNDSITGMFVGEEEKTIEKIISMEVWVNTYIGIELNEKIIIANLYLDNDTFIEKELEFYLNDEFVQTSNTFNLSNTSPGTYSLKVVSQGSPTQYLNPSEIEKQVEVKENGEITILEDETKDNIEEILEEVNDTFIETNLTILNQTLNETLNETVEFDVTLLQDKTCEEFTEYVIWSSGYTLAEEGSTRYHSWRADNTCESINKKYCVLKNIEVETRFIYSNLDNSNNSENNFIQITQLDESICNNPELGDYSNSKYLALESFSKEDVKKSVYCDKNPNVDCKNEITSIYEENSNCYGIKASASQYTIVDVFKIRYDLCSQGGKNEF